MIVKTSNNLDNAKNVNNLKIYIRQYILEYSICYLKSEMFMISNNYGEMEIIMLKMNKLVASSKMNKIIIINFHSKIQIYKNLK